MEDGVKKDKIELINIQTEVTKQKLLHFYADLGFQSGTEVNE